MTSASVFSVIFGRKAISDDETRVWLPDDGRLINKWDLSVGTDQRRRPPPREIDPVLRVMMNIIVDSCQEDVGDTDCNSSAFFLFFLESRPSIGYCHTV